MHRPTATATVAGQHLLAAGDVAGLLAYYASLAGDLRMEGDPPTLPAPTPAPTGAAGGEEALRRDLAAERDRRQQAERERDALRGQNVDADVTRRVEEARTTAATEARRVAEEEARQRLEPILARAVMTEARSAAVAAGVQAGEAAEGGADRVDRFLRLVDLAGLVGDDGTVDSAVLTQRVADAAKTNPEFIAAGAKGRRGDESGPQGGGAGPTTGRLSDRVDAALAAMRSELHIPAPAKN